jgi:hypothetical protein
MGSAMNGLPRRSLLRAALLVPAGAALTGGVLAACGSGAEPAPTIVRGPMLTPDSDGTGRVRPHGLSRARRCITE